MGAETQNVFIIRGKEKLKGGFQTEDELERHPGNHGRTAFQEGVESGLKSVTENHKKRTENGGGSGIWGTQLTGRRVSKVTGVSKAAVRGQDIRNERGGEMESWSQASLEA